MMVQVWASITRALGSSIWQHTIIALSHGRMNTLPPETSYGVPPSPLPLSCCTLAMPLPEAFWRAAFTMMLRPWCANFLQQMLPLPCFLRHPSLSA